MPALPDLILYSRAGCGLCDEAHRALTALLGDRLARGLRSPTLHIRDIDTDEALQRDLFDRIPVVEIGERRLELATSVARLRRLLAETLGD